MQCSDLEIILIGILMISIRLQAYTVSMVITVSTACLMGIHQMHKFLKNEKIAAMAVATKNIMKNIYTVIIPDYVEVSQIEVN
jgi:hypothetical protein